MSEKRFNAAVAVALTLAVALTVLLMVFPEILLGGGAQDEDAVALRLGYENEMFSGDHVAQLDIQVDEEDWKTMLENATAEEYIMCNVTIDGETFYGVGIRPKGNSSLSQTVGSGSDRVSFKIEFDHYVSGQTYHGLDKLALNSNYADSTCMKEYLSYAMFDSMGVTSSLTAFANITVNGEPWGCYLAVECLEESYALRNFGLNYGKLYKPESSMDMGFGAGGSGSGTDLAYTDDDLESYDGVFNGAVFEDTTEADNARVVAALKGLSTGENLEEYIDVDQTLRYFAVNTVLVNLDHYTGSFKHNYYLYEQDGVLSMLPWDYNLAFGGFQGGSASDSVNFPMDTPVSGDSLENRPMIGKLLENAEYLERYHAYIDEIVTTWFENGKFAETIDAVDAMIGEYVKSDATAFFTYEEYQTAIEALKLFGELRGESLRGQLDGTIPSTTEGQKQDPASLVDCSALNMSDMGSMNGGGMNGNGGFPGGTADMPGLSGNFDMPNGMEMPDGATLPDGTELPEGIALPDGMEPPEGMEFPQNGGFPGGIQNEGTENNSVPPELPAESGKTPPEAAGQGGNAPERGTAEPAVSGAPAQTAGGEAQQAQDSAKQNQQGDPPEKVESSGGQPEQGDANFRAHKGGGKNEENGGRFAPGGMPGSGTSNETWIVLGVCAAALAAALLFAILYKKRKFRSR